MEQPGWRSMASAPTDGTRVLVTVRPSEQGSANVDVAYWGRADRFGMEGWRSADSYPDQIVLYADTELKCWMPLPRAGAADASMPAPWEGTEEELNGSGI